MWVRLDNGVQTFASAWPETQYRDPGANYPAVLYAWRGVCWNENAKCLEFDGSGHANGSSNERFRWSAASRGFSLAFYGSQHINVWPYGGRNTHRVKGFNDAPTARHVYANACHITQLDRVVNFGGAAWNDGFALRVFDEAIPGDQEGLRIAGCFTIDMTLAGQGYTLGATGTNYGPSLPGANACQLRDWLHPDHPSRPVFGGNTYATHQDRGAQATVENVGGTLRDVVYYTAGSNFGLLRTVFRANPLDDTTTLVCNGLGFDGDGEVCAGGNIALDPVGRVVCFLARGASTFEPFRFVDLDAPTPAFTQPISPSGLRAELKAEPKGEPSLTWEPNDGCYVAMTRGSTSTPGIFPAGVYRIFPPARSGGLIPAAGFSIDRRNSPAGAPLPPAGPVGGESFISIAGAAPYAPSLGVILHVTSNGEVHAYIPENWPDPEA